MSTPATDPNAGPPSSAAVDAANPWLGLASFTEETRAFFHGREEEVAELGRRVQRKLLTVLFGQSGLGKTSILRAGIVPRLRPEGFCPVYVRLDYGREAPPPAVQIKQAIIRATGASGRWTRPGVAEAGETLWEFLHHRDDTLRDADGRTLVPLLIFDQFEEIFTLAQGDDFGRRRAAEFAEELADLAENRAPRALEARLERDDASLERFDFARADYRILIALREDYLAHLEGLKGQMPSVTQNRMRLARMTGEQATAAVTGPGGALVSAEVARAIVGFVAGGADLARAEVEPSLLSLVCRELNRTRVAQGRPEISADLLAGSRDTILSEFYERTLADQPAGVRAFIEDELLTDSGYRESIAEERVKKGFAAAGAPPEALAALVDRRLLRVEERLDLRRVELTHDVLVGVVKASRDVRQEREARVAEERRRRETEAALAAARADETAARRSAVRARFVATGCTVLALVAAGAAGWGWVNLRRAEAAEGRVAQERDRVQLARAEAERLVSFLLDDLYTQLEPTSRIEVVSGLARRALAYFDALPPELRDARSERYRAIALGRLGAALSQQGKTLEAEAPLQAAEELFTRLQTAGDRSAEAILGLASVLRQQGRNAYLQNRGTVSVEVARRSVAAIEAAAQAPGAPANLRLEYGRALLGLGFNLTRDWQAAAGFDTLAAARTVLKALASEPADAARAGVLYAEACAWSHEAGERTGRGAESEPLLDEALRIATEVAQREPGHLGALRSRGLLLGRQQDLAVSAFEYVRAEDLARQQMAAWEEFLRFDPDNETGRNNRRGAAGSLASALFDQGKLDAAIEVNKASSRELLAGGGSPSMARSTAAGLTATTFLEAELGRVTDPAVALADIERVEVLSASEVDPESYLRFSLPLWSEIRRANLLQRLGRSAEALALSRDVERKAGDLRPDSGANRTNQRILIRTAHRTQVQAALAVGDREAGARAARNLLSLSERVDRSRAALEGQAVDQVWAAVALARVGDAVQARGALEAGGSNIRDRFRAGDTSHGIRYGLALVSLAEGLLAETPAAAAAAFSAGLAEFAAMPSQPQQMRSYRELRATLEAELARVRR